MYGISEYQYLYTYLHLVYKFSGKHKFPSSATSTPLVKITTPLGPLWLGGRSPWMIPVFPYKHVAWRQVKGPKFTSQRVSMDEFINVTYKTLWIQHIFRKLVILSFQARFNNIQDTLSSQAFILTLCSFCKKQAPSSWKPISSRFFVEKMDVFNYLPTPVR